MYSEPSKDQWMDRNKSRRKRKISVYSNEMTELRVLKPKLNHQINLEYLNQAKYSKIISKNTGIKRCFVKLVSFQK